MKCPHIWNISIKINLTVNMRVIRNRNNTNGPYMESDYNEALWSIDDILRRQPPCTRFVKSNITTTSIK